jgi:hypothetical protein
MEWIGKVDVLEYYPELSIESASEEFPVPAVIRVRMYVHKSQPNVTMMVSRRNIMIRDRHTCQCAPAFLSSMSLSLSRSRVVREIDPVLVCVGSVLCLVSGQCSKVSSFI